MNWACASYGKKNAVSSNGPSLIPTNLPPTIKVSIGSAGVLGLADVQQTDPPTTAYLMLGEGCTRDCAFCAQARRSQANANALSRVIWPPYDSLKALKQLAACHLDGRIQRACLQVTTFAGHVNQASAVLSHIRQHSAIPLSLSIAVPDLAAISKLFGAGADRIGLAIDGATPETYARVKGSGWPHAIGLLADAARAFPGRISTHLIVGLGETEREMVQRFQWCADRHITIGLFAFTPVAGTPLAQRSQPSLASYRRLQAARYLITQGTIRATQIQYNGHAEIVSYGLSGSALQKHLEQGDAFRTSGCPDCNRPYYNERPGGDIYNYARPLGQEELAAAWRAIDATESAR